VSYKELKQFAPAISTLRQSLLKDYSNASTHSYLGEILYQTEQYDSSLNSFNRAVNLAPNDGSSLMGLGYSAFELNDYGLAAGALKKAEEVGKHETKMDFYLGYSFAQLNYPKEALPYLHKFHESKDAKRESHQQLTRYAIIVIELSVGDAATAASFAKAYIKDYGKDADLSAKL